MDTNLISLKIPNILLMLSLFFLAFTVVNVYGYDTKDIKLLLSALTFFTFSVGMFVCDKFVKLECYMRNKMDEKKLKSQTAQ